MRNFALKFLLASFTLLTPTLEAVDQYWDPDFTEVPSGGFGYWDGSTTNWLTGTALETWGSDTAIFGTTGGTVIIDSSNIFFNNIQFLVDGYTIESVIPYVLEVNPTNNGTILTDNVNATIACPLTFPASSTLTKTGPGTLFLTNGANQFNGPFTVNNSGGTTENIVNIQGPTGAAHINDQLTVGLTDSYNTFAVTNGAGVMANADAIVGGSTGANDNTLLVSDPSSYFIINGSNVLYIGQFGNFNDLFVENGGVVTVNTSKIGFDTNSMGNVAKVTGTNSMWGISQELDIGTLGSNNRMVVQNGGEADATTIYVGREGTANGNALLVSSGGRVIATNLFIGGDINGANRPNNNFAQVTNSGSQLNVSDIIIGKSGTNSSLTVSDNGVINTNTGITIAELTGSSGTLFIGEGGAPGIINVIGPNAQGIGAGNGMSANVVFNHNSSNYTFAPAMVVSSFFPGTLDVQQTGPGRTILTANNTYTGTTTIDNGTWSAGGVNVYSPNSPVVVNQNGALNLEGFDQTVDNLVNNGLVDYGGTNPGTTLTVVQNFVQNSTGTLNNKINVSGQTDFLTAGMAANLGGTLAVNSVNGYTLSETYRIIHANQGVFGNFNTVTAPNSLVKPFVLVEQYDAFLYFQPNLISAARTHNQAVVANQLDNIQNPIDDILTVLDALINSSPDTASLALDQMAGEQYTSLVQIDRNASEGFSRRIYNAMRNTLSPCTCRDRCQTLVGWFQAEGGQSFMHQDRNTKGLRALNWDFSLGCFVINKNGFSGGVAANYRTHHVNFLFDAGRANWNTAEGAFYGAYSNDWGYVFADVIMGQSWGEMKRKIDFDSIHRIARSHPKVTDGLGYGELGCTFRSCGFILQPFVGVEIGFYRQCHSTEEGAGSLNLRQRGRTTNIYDTYLGAHLMKCEDCFVFSADVAWQHRFNRTNVLATNQFTGNGTSFVIDGTILGNNGIKGALNVSRDVNRFVSLYAQLYGEGWERWASYGIDLGINVRW